MHLFAALGRMLFGRLSFCALAGGIAGAVVGLLWGAYLYFHPTVVLTAPELLLIALLLGAAAWLWILLLIGVWLHYGAAAIAMPSLINAVSTAILTVFAVYAANLPHLAAPLGIAAGIAVGAILCRICAWGNATTGRVQR